MHTTPPYSLGTLANGERVDLHPADRRRHVYVVGQTGTGKTGLLVNLMRADMEAGAGFCFLDPHGDACKHIASLAPSRRMSDVIYLDPSDQDYTFAYNPLSDVPRARRATTAANIVSAFRAIWASSWGPRLEHIFLNSLRLLLDAKDQSLLGLPRLLVDEPFREWLLRRCEDPVIRAFWFDQYAAYDARLRNESISPIQNKVGAFLANPFIRTILCQNTSTLDIARAMNSGRVLIINLSKGNLGEEPAHLLGALFVTAFSQAAEARRNIPEEERRDFTLYVDEFQNFATDSFASILSESRKWRLSLVAANQHIAQLPEALREAMFGNVGTLLAFRTGARDAELVAPELGAVGAQALTQTANYHAWVKLMRDGAPLEPHLLKTFAPPLMGTMFDSAVAYARARHMRPRADVDAQIAAFYPTPADRRSRRRKRRDPDTHHDAHFGGRNL